MFEFEQIPLRLVDMSFSVVSTSYHQASVDSYEEERMERVKGIDMFRKIAQIGEICPTEKLKGFVLEANQYHPYKPYHISYGYHYINENNAKISREFKTQAERNQSALEETGYDFDKLDWSDKIAPSNKVNDTSKAVPKKSR